MYVCTDSIPPSLCIWHGRRCWVGQAFKADAVGRAGLKPGAYKYSDAIIKVRRLVKMVWSSVAWCGIKTIGAAVVGCVTLVWGQTNRCCWSLLFVCHTMIMTKQCNE